MLVKIQNAKSLPVLPIHVWRGVLAEGPRMCHSGKDLQKERKYESGLHRRLNNIRRTVCSTVHCLGHVRCASLSQSLSDETQLSCVNDTDLFHGEV